MSKAGSESDSWTMIAANPIDRICRSPVAGSRSSKLKRVRDCGFEKALSELEVLGIGNAARCLAAKHLAGFRRSRHKWHPRHVVTGQVRMREAVPLASWSNRAGLVVAIKGGSPPGRGPDCNFDRGSRLLVVTNIIVTGS